MRTHSLANLYFRFIRGTTIDGGANWDDAAEALVRAGLIELIPSGSGDKAFTHYTETERMRALPADALEHLVTDLIRDLVNERKEDLGDK